MIYSISHSYDYIFLGGGISVYILLLHLCQHKEHFLDKKILIIQGGENNTHQEKKISFWSEEFPSLLLGLQHHKRSTSRISSHSNKQSTHISSIPYRSISSQKLFLFIKEKIILSGLNITSVYEDVCNTHISGQYHIISTTSNHYQGSMVFNSISNFCKPKTQKHMFWQCFVGYDISYDTSLSLFNEQEAHVMEFDTNQDNINFIYTLPTSSYRALVEYTYFVPYMLSYNHIEQQLKDHLSLLGSYTLHSIERGAIPMQHTTYRGSQSFIDIGSAGGAIKPSSGYTFVNILRHSRHITQALINQTHISKSYHSRHRWYDSIMLQVMSDYPKIYHDISFRLFYRTPPHHLISFLNEESTLLEELSIIRSLPKRIFIKALFRYYFGGKT